MKGEIKTIYDAARTAFMQTQRIFKSISETVFDLDALLDWFSNLDEKR